MPLNKWTIEELEQGVEHLAGHVPDEGGQLLELKKHIAKAIHEDEDIGPGHPLYDKDYTGDIPDYDAMDDLELTKCQNAILDTVFDGVVLLFDIIGLHGTRKSYVKKAMKQAMGKEGIIGLEASIRAIQEASSGAAKFEAVFNFFVEVYNVSAMGAALSAIRKHMSYWDWIKAGVSVGLQIASWFLTGGWKAFADVASTILDAESFTEDLINVHNCC